MKRIMLILLALVLVPHALAQDGTLRRHDIESGAIDLTDGNITSVGDIELDTISNEDGTLSMTIAASTGNVTFNGDIIATGSIVGYLEGVSAAGAHTVSAAQDKGGYILVTAVGDVDLPDVCDSATFASIKIVVRDVGETVSVTVANAGEDTLIYPGLALGAGDELDSPGAALDDLTCVCAETNNWYCNGTAGWTDGGVDD